MATEQKDQKDTKTGSTSQSQHFSNGFGAAQAPDAFRKLLDEQIARLGEMSREMEKLQATTMDQARQAIDESARLFKESLNYGGLMMNEWRRMALEASRQAVDAFDAVLPAPARG